MFRLFRIGGYLASSPHSISSRDTGDIRCFIFAGYVDQAWLELWHHQASSVRNLPYQLAKRRRDADQSMLNLSHDFRSHALDIVECSLEGSLDKIGER